jgi:hypothetical protein
MIRRKPLTRKNPMKRGGRLKPMSRAKAAMMPEYREAVRAALAAQVDERGHYYCVRCHRRCLPGAHHTHGRTRENLLRFVLLGWECCHEWIHNNARAARAEGWLK